VVTIVQSVGGDQLWMRGGREAGHASRAVAGEVAQEQTDAMVGPAHRGGQRAGCHRNLGTDRARELARIVMVTTHARTPRHRSVGGRPPSVVLVEDRDDGVLGGIDDDSPLAANVDASV